MPEQETQQQASEPRRKEIFQALVEAQDGGMGVTESRQVVAQRFGLTEGEMAAIEREGLDHDWPPL
jgi:hypothetical protein